MFFFTHTPRHVFLLAVSIGLVGGGGALADELPTSASIRGTVIDFKTREPLGQVKVTLRGLKREVVTDAAGRFELSQLPAGEVALMVTTVGYGPVSRALTLSSSQVLELTVPLGAEAVKPGAAANLEAQTVTVVGRVEPRARAAAPSVHDISNTDLQNLSTVLGNDPLRAVHSLPGVTANQDFYGQFGVRGAAPSHVGVEIDGVLLDNAFHGFTDQGDLGSVSIVNGALVDSTTLYSGVAPVRFGGRTGGALQIETREGSRDEAYTRLDLDLLSASVTHEGPFGSDKRGSYVVSARKSYLDYLMSKLKNNSGSLGYSDLDLKADYALTANDKLSFTTVLGTSAISREPQPGNAQSLGTLTDGSGRQAFTTLRWTSELSAQTRSRAQVFWALDSQTQRNQDQDLLRSQRATQFGVREQLTHRLSAQHTLDAGLGVVRRHTALEENSLWDYRTGSLSPSLVAAAEFSKGATETSAHVQDGYTSADQALKATLGARWDRSSATGQSVFLPRLDTSLMMLPGTQLSAGVGQSAQFPSLDQLSGKFGTPGLKAERATTAALALDQDLGDRWRLHAEWYTRRESDLIDSPETHFRLTAEGSYAVPSAGPVLTNQMKGRTHGVELMLQRQSANGLSGWLTYSRSFSRNTPTDGSASFWGDLDQRTAVTAYASYRWTDTVSFSANARYGSGTPLAGYFGESNANAGRGGETLVAYDLASARNLQRMGSYQRLDLRANKVIYGSGYKLTLKAEIANVLGHDNWRYYDVSYPAPGVAQPVQITRNTTMPRLPTVGLSLEF